MLPKETEVVIVGGGQSGIAASEHLSASGIAHIVLEQGRIAERWRSGRWDSLVANGPAWHDRFPGLEFEGTDGDAFVPKEQVADYFVRYAKMINAPIHCDVKVARVSALDGAQGFLVETSAGTVRTKNVIAATGPFQTPVHPPLVPPEAPVDLLHSEQYKNPAQLAPGAVLVVGAGSSGVQIADELQRSGRRVFLSIGAHDRLPRRYRGRDYVWWMGVLGMWDDERIAPGKEHISISVSGAYGGRTIDFRDLATEGMTLLGLTSGYDGGAVSFAPDLPENFAAGDAYYLSFLDQCDAWVAANGLELPPDPKARTLGPIPDHVSEPIATLDLAQEGVSTILWATGYRPDFSWLAVDVFDADGKPDQLRGVGKVPGIYFLGLPFMMSRGSSFIYGVWHDAKHVADHIFIQQKYSAYSGHAKIVHPPE